MGIKYYKLTEYDPFWIYADGKYPRKHIEQIVTEYEAVLWEEVKNFQWTDIDNLSATGFNEDIPKYVKVDVNGDIYYYYLLNKSAVLASKDGKTQYRAVYALDEYMTCYWAKLELIRAANPSVYVNMGFKNRWNDRRDSQGNLEYYEFDFIKQRHLSNTLSERNNMMVRKLAYSTTANDIYELNYPDTVIPASINIHRYNTGSNDITISDLANKLNTPNSRGRYLYYIAKSTAKMRSNNDKLINAHTDQQFIVIPFFAGNENNIWHGLNDFDITVEADGFLVPQGDNEIGLWESDLPYSYFYGLVANNLYGAKFEYAHQTMGSESYVDIPFFTIDNNAPLILKIIDYAKYGDGFYGKFLNIINNIYEWTPETEPALLNPTYYRETFNNGESELTIDASMFNFKWNSETIDEFGIQAYLSLSSQLAIAYNFGVNTNTQLAAFDNTETKIGKGSITNMYMGSNSASYYTTNAATTATSLQNRQSEEAQAWTDASLSTAKLWVNAAPNGIAEAIFSTGKIVKRGITAALDTAKIMTDTALTQQRANREFNASINNMTSAPAQVLSDPSIKGVIPIKHGLFETYSFELHPSDKRVIFNSYLHNGYPINEVMLFNDVADNRKFMNVINLNTQYFTDDLYKILNDNDTTIFNTKFWNQRFLSFLNSSFSIYNSTRLINVTDYMGVDYLSNIENNLPDIPHPKTNIARYITNFRGAYEANYDFIAEALEEDNSDAPDDLWDSIIVEQMEFGGFIITAVPDSDYYGSIVVNAVCYNGYILEDDQGDLVYHYFWDVDFLCFANLSISTITCPDGTIFDKTTFNYPIIFIENNNLSNIGYRFLFACQNFNQELVLPNSITSIGDDFLGSCKLFNKPLSLPNNLISIGIYFMASSSSFNQELVLPQTLLTIGYGFLTACHSFNQELVLPNSITSIGIFFLNDCFDMVSKINIQDLQPNIFDADSSTLATYDNSARMYQQGIEIVGTHKADFLERFPNSDASPYRKLK